MYCFRTQQTRDGGEWFGTAGDLLQYARKSKRRFGQTSSPSILAPRNGTCFRVARLLCANGAPLQASVRGRSRNHTDCFTTANDGNCAHTGERIYGRNLYATGAAAWGSSVPVRIIGRREFRQRLPSQRSLPGTPRHFAITRNISPAPPASCHRAPRQRRFI